MAQRAPGEVIAANEAVWPAPTGDVSEIIVTPAVVVVGGIVTVMPTVLVGRGVSSRSAWSGVEFRNDEIGLLSPPQAISKNPKAEIKRMSLCIQSTPVWDEPPQIRHPPMWCTS